MMVATLLSFAAAASADADPIRVSSLSEPQSVISEQDVDITIKIYNSSQTDMQEEITLYDSNGAPVETYDGLKGENSVTYTGKWHVTADQIKEGKIKFFISYSVDTGNGPTQTTRTVPITIQTEEAAPQLTATYTVTPSAARQGQEVKLAYTLSNTGNIELRNIEITNEGASERKVSAASLSVGEKVTLEDTFTMGSKELVSKPTITYQAAGSTKTLTISDMARKTITVAEDGLDVTLTAENTENIYPGENVKMTLDIKNSGNTAYTGLSAVLSDGTALASGIDLAPGASFTQEVDVAVSQSGAYSVTVTGADSTGEAVSVASPEITLTTQDASKALVLNVRAQAETTTIYSEPAVVRFAVVVENIGQTDATTLTIREAGTTVATIPSLPAGESRTVVFDLQTSIAGQIQFTVTGKDMVGNDKTYTSDIIQLTYVAPTPEPTAAPTPTAVPPTPTPEPTATPKPSLVQIVRDSVDPRALYVAAGVLAAVVAALVVSGGMKRARKAKIEKNAIDTIELTPDVRNHRGLRRKAQKAAEKPIKSPEKETTAIVPTPELTEEDGERQPEKSERPEAETEGRRRRAQQEFPLTADETLRVAPVDQRPEFIAQGKVDDSQTRVFTRLADSDGKPKEEPAKAADAERKDEPEKPAKAEEGAETIRFSRAELDDALKRQSGGRKRSEIKPMKKKKKGLFGRKEAEDDLVDAEDDFDHSDDDFIE
ncbi:MAG: hypothetical protein Q4G52_06320 [Clostridia bacterium]|nr:hypothetical protein [Clostridia bacterium]